MDAGMKNEETGEMQARLFLGRSFIWCFIPLLQCVSAAEAQAVLNAINLLVPKADLRQLQALLKYRAGSYMEAMEIWLEIDTMPARALAALCLEAIGEPSWIGAAQAVYESGDAQAMEIVAPWLEKVPAGYPTGVEGACAPSQNADPAEYSFRPLRA